MGSWNLSLMFTTLILTAQCEASTQDFASNKDASQTMFSNYEQAYQKLNEIQSRADVLSKVDPAVIKALSGIRPEGVIQGAASAELSKPCHDAIQLILQASTSPWVLKYYDSWGKLGSGVYDGHIHFPGSYDECKNLTGEYKVGDASNGTDFTTNYCTAELAIPLIPAGAFNLQLGVCVPAQCNSTEVAKMYSEEMKRVLIPGLPLYVAGASCQLLDRTLTTGQTVALVFVCIVIGACCLATLFDGILQLIAGRSLQRRASAKFEEDDTTNLVGSTSIDETVKTPLPQGYLTRTVLAFSFYHNICKILCTDQPASSLACLHGIRFFSMTWVILGHTLMLCVYGVINNTIWILDLMKRFSFSPILNATVSVDTFFVLSGLLVSYLLLRDFKRQIQILGFFKALPIIYLHRYLRLTPAYGFMILIHTCLVWYMRDGPFFPSTTNTVDKNCVNNWYLNILYVNNLFKMDQQCAAWGWYLANDMQFFLVAPFLVFIFYLSNKAGFILCIVSILGSIGAAIGVSDIQRTSFILLPQIAHQNFTPEANVKLPYYDEPWCRYQTYGVGILAGFIIFKLQEKNLKIPKVINVILWGVSAGVCMSVVYGPYNAQMGYHTVYLGEAVIYNGLSRTAWGLGISYVMISCSLGQGGWVNEFLSWKGFVPLSRLTYCAYLIHIPVMFITIFGIRNGSFFGDIEMVQTIILNVVSAFLVAFVFSLLFEAPFINLDKIYLAPLSLRNTPREENRGSGDTESVGESSSSRKSSIVTETGWRESENS